MKNSGYNPKNIDKALKRMEDADNLKDIKRSGTNIMSFFDENDKENKLQKNQSTIELKKEKYLKKIESLKKLIKEKRDRFIQVDRKNKTEDDFTRITAFGCLIETTDFLNISPNRKNIIKENMIWCNKQYEKYVDTTK